MYTYTHFASDGAKPSRRHHLDEWGWARIRWWGRFEGGAWNSRLMQAGLLAGVDYEALAGYETGGVAGQEDDQ